MFLKIGTLAPAAVFSSMIPNLQAGARLAGERQPRQYGIGLFHEQSLQRWPVSKQSKREGKLQNSSQHLAAGDEGYLGPCKAW